MLQTTAYLLLDHMAQTRAFLISVNHRGDFSGWFDNSKKGEVFGQIEWMGG